MYLRRTFASELLPRPARLPPPAPMSFRHHSSNERHGALLDLAYNRLERNRLDKEAALRIERIPLALFRFVLKKLRCERDWRCRREPGLASLECPHDRFGEDLPFE